MILPYQTKFKDGTPTEFVGKIWASIIPFSDGDIKTAKEILIKCIAEGYIRHAPTVGEIMKYYNPKLHTMRNDSENRWHTGSEIRMVVSKPSKNQFQFVPVLECISVQRVFMTNINGFEISIDGKYQTFPDIETLAVNDGFQNASDMEDYFFPPNCKHDECGGKIIHWTNLTY